MGVEATRQCGGGAEAPADSPVSAGNGLFAGEAETHGASLACCRRKWRAEKPDNIRRSGPAGRAPDREGA